MSLKLRSTVDCLTALTEGAKRVKVTEDGVVKGVHILGYTSKNGLTYTREAVAAAVPLYEGKKVYADHPVIDKDGNETPRSVKEIVATIQAPVTREATGMWGDLHLNTGHPYYEHFRWLAENAPGEFGLSHSVFGEKGGAGKSIIRIAEVESVDLVTTPATVKGLFESLQRQAKAIREGVVADKMTADWEGGILSRIVGTVNSLAWDSLCDTQKGQPEQAKALAALFSDAAKELRSISTPTAESAMTIDFKLLTREALIVGAPAIVAAIEADAVKAALAADAKVRESLAKVPEAARTKVFEKQVRAAVASGDESALAELVEDRLAVAKVTEGAKPDEAKADETPAADVKGIRSGAGKGVEATGLRESTAGKGAAGKDDFTLEQACALRP